MQHAENFIRMNINILYTYIEVPRTYMCILTHIKNKNNHNNKIMIIIFLSYEYVSIIYV